MEVRNCDVLVIGGGPGGLAAAKAAKEAGADKVILLERDDKVGGILNQCIHAGFGLIRYGEELTGPEYASRAASEVRSLDIEILTDRHVMGLKNNSIDSDDIIYAYSKNGIEKYKAKSIVLATGCRERTRGNISIPGSRPAGVFTAGVAQNLINCRNIMIGKRVVILGSGDIGLIMARRLTLEGAEVMAVVEIMPEPMGLARNVSQCVYEFDIPLYVNTTISNIIGKHKIEAVELSEVDEDRNILPNTKKRIECDALVLSVGLIPENEVAETMGVRLKSDNSVDTDEYLQTSVAGVFSCGNSRHVMDLADYVSEQGEMAGRNAVHFLNKEEMESWDESRTNCMKKGFPKEGTITCTVCPNGCQVKWDEEKDIYSGNKCPRGEKFAKQERIEPRRMFTTTMKLKNKGHTIIPVRTAFPIRRDNVMDLSDFLRNESIDNIVAIGDEVSSTVINGEEIQIISVTDTN